MDKLVVENQMPCTGGFDLAAISALVNSNRGMSPEALMALCQQKGLGGGDGGSLIVLILFLLLIGGNNGGGLFGGNNNGSAAPAMAQSNFDTSILLRAVDGNAADMRTLATTFNCDINRITEALSTIKGGVDKVAGEVRSTSKDVINAIQAGNCQLSSQLSSCCCSIEKSILMQTTTINAGFAQIGFQQAQDKCEILHAIKADGDATRKIIYDAEKQALRDRIAGLELAASQQAQTANLGNALSAQTAALTAVIRNNS